MFFVRLLFYAAYEKKLMCINTDGSNNAEVASGMQQIQGLGVDKHGTFYLSCCNPMLCSGFKRGFLDMFVIGIVLVNLSLQTMWVMLLNM